MSSGSQYSPSREELEEAECETTASDLPSEPEQPEQHIQVPARRRCNVPQRDEDLYIDNEQLIILVQERVPLWDSRDQQYKDNVVTRQLWNEVAPSFDGGLGQRLCNFREGVYEQSPHTLALNEGPLQH
ncbi:uncharacterized protein [Dendrobates tinctorius]|uniref:uncharacterized protein isoform X2 n=1 Tax=Dendrobates tinctorius TaxID=92724 RepID=UPI003CC976B0